MIRTLFFEEFVKRFLKVMAFAAGAAILTLGVKTMLLRWSDNAAQVHRGFEGTLVVCLLLIVAGTGAGTFTRSFREGPMRLLDVLPVPRAATWLIRVFTSFASACVAAVVFLMVHPNLLRQSDSEILFIVTGFGLLLFSLACLASTLVNTPTLVSAGFSALFGLAILFVLVTAEDFLRYGTPSRGFIVEVVAGGLLPAVCLAFSLLVFVRGEMDTPRRQWRNIGAGGLVLLGTLFLAVAALDAGAFDMNSPWKTDDLRASHTGTYVAAVQFKGRYSPKFRVVVVETATGNVRKTYEGRGWAGEEWTPDDALLVFTKSSTLRYLLHLGAETIDVARIFPTEKIVFHQTDYRLGAASSDQRGALLLLRDAPLLASTSHSLLLRMDSSGQTKELFKVPGFWFSAPKLDRAFDGNALTMNDVVWRIHDNAVRMLFNVGPFRFADGKEADRVYGWLRDNRPPIRPGLPLGKYFADRLPAEFGDSSWLYYLQPDPVSRTAQLWARRKTDPAWQELVKGIALTESEMDELSKGTRNPFTLATFRNVSAGTRTGIVASLLVQKIDAIHLVVFDLNSRQRYDLGDMSTIPGQGLLRVAFPRPFEALIGVYRNNFENYLRGGFHLEPGKSPPMRLTQPGDPRGNIRFLEGGGRLYFTGDATTGFDIFSEKPGEEPRLLLAARESFR